MNSVRVPPLMILSFQLLTVYRNLENKGIFSLVGNGFKLFLSKAQSCLDGTPFKAPVTAINV